MGKVDESYTTSDLSSIKAIAILEYVSWQMADKGIMHLDENSPFQLCLIQTNEYAYNILNKE